MSVVYFKCAINTDGTLVESRKKNILRQFSSAKVLIENPDALKKTSVSIIHFWKADNISFY